MTEKDVIRDIRIVLEIKATEILNATGQMPVWYNGAFEWMDKQEQKPANANFSDLKTWKYVVDAVMTEIGGIGQYLDSPITEGVARTLQKRFGNIEQKPAEPDNTYGPDFIEKVRRLAEYLKNDPGEQKLQAEIHSWFENDKSQISMTKIWHKGDAFKDEKCMRLENWVIGNAENKRFVAGPVLEVTDGCIDIMDEDGSVAMVLRKEDTWAYMSDLLKIMEIPQLFPIISQKELPISDDLEKAAAEWDRNASFQPIHMIMDGDRPIGTKQSITTHGDSFKAGAQWKMQEMMKEAIGGMCMSNGIACGSVIESPAGTLFLQYNTFDVNDNVKILIIKED